MAICNVCGKVNSGTARNCDVCGAPLHAADPAPVHMVPTAVATQDGMSGPICPICKRGNRSASLFCAHCGYRLKPANGHQPPSALPYAMPASQAAPHTAHIQDGTPGSIPQGTLLKRRYRILRKIAQGGMGAVYEASDLLAPDRSRWAIKEMSPSSLQAGERTQAIADFRREAHMLATLRHPNLPEVVETFEEAGKHFLVMEFVAGRTLLSTLENAPGYLPEERIMAWGRQLFDVVQYLHSQNPPIIYRDLKPANIMLVEGTERIKLIDFGIARFHKAGKSQDTEAFGTAGYAPPEQYGKGQTDQRSDIYALAATLHYLLTKHDPSLNPFNWLPARRYNPAVSARTESALVTALNLDPQRRFGSVEAFAQALGVQLPEMRPAQIQAPVAPPAPAATPEPQSAQEMPVYAPTQPESIQPRPKQKKKGQPEPVPLLQPTPTALPEATEQPPTIVAPVMPQPHSTFAPLLQNGGTPTQMAAQADAVETYAQAEAAPTSKQKKKKQVVQEPTAPLVVSDRLVDLGETRWNSRPARKIGLRGAGGGPVRGFVAASHPWIAYDPKQFNGSAVTLEVKVRPRGLRLGRVELQVPNLFAIIWSRTRTMLPLIGCWFWLIVLVASSLGRYLMWGLAAAVGAVFLLWGLMWLWAQHVKLLVPAPKLNTGRLMVRSPGGDQSIEVRVVARPSSARRAIGWVLAGVLFTTELAATALLLLALWGVPIPIPSL